MRRRQFGIGVLALAGDQAHAQAPTNALISWDLRPIVRQGVNWRLIAKSSLIVSGKVSALPHPLENKPGYVRLPINVTSLLSGTEAHRTIEFTYSPYVHPSAVGVRSPSPAEVTNSLTNESIFYLQWVDRTGDLPEGTYMFADYSPEALTPSSFELEARVRKEAEAQEILAAQVASLLSTHKPPLDDRVAVLADEARRGNTQASLNGLLALNNDALPAMVMRLDDRKPVRDGSISISLKSSFEALSHYNVVDIGGLMMFALHHKTENGFFGWPDEENSERRRKRIVAAWRVWLGYSLGLSPK